MNQPAHLNINSLEIMPVSQSGPASPSTAKATGGGGRARYDAPVVPIE